MISCPVCGSESFKPHWDCGSFAYVRCRGCGLRLQNPQPRREALAARYDAEYFAYEKQNEENFYGLMRRGLEDVRFFESLAPTLPSPGSMLDIGCATGRLLRDFREMGWNTLGVEICTESAEYGKETHGVEIFNGTLESADLPDRRFSFIHASHLIEHVDDPAAFVREVYRLLIPGGLFVCTTPSADGFQARWFGSRWRSAIADHVTLFDGKTLRTLLQGAGLVVEKQKTWGGIAAGTAPKWIKNPLDRGAKIFGYGDVVLMAARRPENDRD